MKAILRSRIFCVLIVLAAAGAILSCGLGGAGTGVLLWSGEENVMPSGTIVSIRNESKLTGTYTITAAGVRERIDVPMWRVQVFKSKKEAQAFAAAYKPYVSLRAKTKKDGLPMRQEPNSESPRVYRLMLNQIIKILDKSAEKTSEGDFEDYWYKALTDDGAVGWVFAHTLELTETEGGPFIAKEQNEDSALAAFLTKTWRPEDFRTLIDDGTIDLNRFRSEYGMFNDPAAKTVKLVTKKQNLTFTYTGIERAVGSLYIFEGTDLQVSLVTEDRIAVQYLVKDKTVTEVYVTLEEDVDEIIKKEQERRRDLFTQLLEKGSVFTSSAFGTVRLRDNGDFTWENFSLLVPDIIPEKAGGGGRAVLEVLLKKELRGQYAGVLSFIFTGLKDPVHFLYAPTPDGIKLLSLPADFVDDNVAEQAPPFPIVISFTGSR